MQTTVERKGGPDRRTAGNYSGAGRPDDRCCTSTNPRRGYPDRSRAGPNREIDLRPRARQRIRKQLGTAEHIPIYDEGEKFLAINVETALAELNSSITVVAASVAAIIPDAFTYRDGSQQPTSSWNFNNKDLQNVKSLAVGHTAAIDFGPIPALQVVGTSISNSAAMLGHWSATDQPATLYFLKSRSAAIGGNTIVQDGDRVGRLRFQVADGTDHKSQVAEIRVEVDGTPGVNDTPGRLLLCTTPAGSKSAVERVSISQAGTVIIKKTLGLGLSGTPDALIEVRADPAATPDDAKAIALVNATAATSGNQKLSPMLRMEARGWGTFGESSDVCGMRTYVVPVQGLTPTSDIVTEYLDDEDWFSAHRWVSATQRFIAGSVNVGDSGVQAGNAFVGTWLAHTSFAVLGHNSVVSTTGSYLALQQNEGTGYLNAASGKILHFRNNNVTIGQLDSNGMGYGGATTPSAILKVVTTTQFFNQGTKTTGQRDGIGSTQDGDSLFNNTIGAEQHWDTFLAAWV